METTSGRLLAVILLFSSVAVVAQRKCKRVILYAFERHTLPGMMLQQEVEDSTTTSGNVVESKLTYYFFADVPRTKSVEIEGAYIRGVFYQLKQPIEQTAPVIIGKTPVGNQIRSDTLVHVARGKLLKLEPEQAIQKLTNSNLQTISKQYELVVLLKMRGRQYFSQVAEIKKLEPLALQ